MEIDEIKARLDRASCPEDVFGELSKADPEDDLKRLYRAYARVLHPDKNSGDGTYFARLSDWNDRALDRIRRGHYGSRVAFTIKSRLGTYEVVGRVASGDLTEVYRAVKDDADDVVVKITRTPTNNDLVENEARRLAHIRQHPKTKDSPALVHIPELVDSFDIRSTGRAQVNVLTDFTRYRTLAEVLAANPRGADGRTAGWMWNRLLQALTAAQGAGLVHGAVIPEHFLLGPQKDDGELDHNGVLIDWSYAVKMGETVRAFVARRKEFYAPEILARQPASGATDIHMAAMCFVYMVGGDPATREMPDTVSRHMRGVVRACLLGPMHRPRRAIDVYDDFKEALEVTFGPPKYHKFVMPPRAAPAGA